MKIVALSIIVMILLTMNFSNMSYGTMANDKISDQYLIILKDNVTNSNSVYADLSTKYGINIIDVYDHVLNGISAKIPQNNVDAIKKDVRVELVEPDFIVKASQLSQVLPTGINRIDVDQNVKAKIDGTDERINADIAIIDTGIDLSHPDLNVVENISFVKGVNTGNDDNGHGTQVAGIAAALDNGFGVVGVAPGARLHAVKVLDSTGFGTISKVIKGMDWVVKNSKTIEVANLSLECACHSKALHKAIQKAVNKGVVIVAAAGNDSSDASNFEPAAYPEVITVSAIVDTDGKCGGLGPTSSFGNDDTLASFSNYGKAVTIAAPGVDILSTTKGGGYTLGSGTSFASPHVTGAVALILHNKSRDLNGDGIINSKDVAIIKNILLSSAISQNKLCDSTLGDGNGGFSGDADGFAEPLLYAKNL